MFGTVPFGSGGRYGAMSYLFGRSKKPILLAFVAGLACVSGMAHGGGLATLSIFDSPVLNREIHGQRHALDLAVGPAHLGQTVAFFGVDSLSDDASHYLTSGLSWQSADQGPSLLTLSATHTAARGANHGSQTLIQAETRLALGERWYLPDFTFEADQLLSGDVGADPGRAFMFGVGQNFAGGRYHVGYFRTGDRYSPWGGTLVTGGRGLKLSGLYNLSSRWRLGNTLLLHHGDVSSGMGTSALDKWRLTGVMAAGTSGKPWRLSGQFGSKNTQPVSDPIFPLAVELAPRTRDWLNWQVDSAIGWYQGDIVAPEGIPVAGALWRVSASHNVALAGLETCFAPSFAIGGSRYAGQTLGGRAGLTLGFPQFSHQISLNVDYLSSGWGPKQPRDEIRMMLRISENTGAILPRLSSLVGRLRGSWFGY